MHQHCNGHRPYSARNRCDRRRMRRNLIISDIPAQLVVLIAVNSHIDDNRPFFDVICRDKLRLSDCNDQDIRRFAKFRQILCLGMCNGDRGILAQH